MGVLSMLFGILLIIIVIITVVKIAASTVPPPRKTPEQLAVDYRIEQEEAWQRALKRKHEELDLLERKVRIFQEGRGRT